MGRDYNEHLRRADLRQRDAATRHNLSYIPMKTDRNPIFLVTFLLFASVSCGGGGAAGGAAGGRRGRNACHGRRDRHPRGEAGRANDRIRRNREIAAIDRDSAPGRGVHHPDHGETGPACRRRRRVDGNRLARAAGAGRGPRVGARAARDRRHVCAAGSRAREQTAEGRRGEPDGGRPRGERPESGRSAAANRAGANPHGAHRPRVLPRDCADRRHRRRHSGPRRRSRDEGDQADVDRCERRPRGVPERAGAAGAEAARSACRCASSTTPARRSPKKRSPSFRRQSTSGRRPCS